MGDLITGDDRRARRGGAWTRDKLVYLRKYAHAFMIAMAPKRDEGKWSRLVFIDLLCGPGIDVINGVAERGSPLLALDTEPKFDRLFLGDLDEDNVETLRQRIRPEDHLRVELLAQDCHVR